MTLIIQSLQAKQLLWQANDLAIDQHHCVHSGYKLLDQKLGGGWPNEGIIELQCQHFGIGEVRLLLPALNQLNQQHDQQALFLWLSPPGRLNAQAIAVADLPLSNTLVADQIDDSDSFWLAEQALRSGCCAAVVLWCEQLTPTQAKRLQLAAKQGHSLGFVLCPPTSIEQSLPVSVRASLDTFEHGLNINITKRLGACPLAPFDLDMRQQWPALYKTDPNKNNVTAIHRSLANSKRE